MAEYASRILNRLSKTTSSNSGHKKNIETVDHPNSCINSANSNSKSQNDVDASCLPNHNDNNNSAPHSDQKFEENSDDSRLPNNNGTKQSNNLTTPSGPNNSIRSQKTVNDSDDYSWLPTTSIVRNENENENKTPHSWLPNYNTKRNASTKASKSFNSNLSRKTERLIHILKIGDKNKEINSSDKIHNKSSNDDQVTESSKSQQKDSCNKKELVNSTQLENDMELEEAHYLITGYSRPQSDGEEEEEDFYNHDDWISNIAKPKSNWECLRQARYKEMLHPYSYKPDIHELLKTKSVSSFLSSDQRDKLELVIVRQAIGVESMKEKGKYEKEENESDQTITESRSCSHPNPVYESGQMVSSSLWQNSTPQSSSIEMELIYDLRGYVEQLHQEILELRKTITSHVNMQHESVQQNRSERISTKPNCCVCNTMQADSFLYRCGHMCTCYDCGLELQYTSGKCPICEDPIVDVVRAYGYDD